MGLLLFVSYVFITWLPQMQKSGPSAACPRRLRGAGLAPCGDRAVHRDCWVRREFRSLSPVAMHRAPKRHLQACALAAVGVTSDTTAILLAAMSSASPCYTSVNTQWQIMLESVCKCNQLLGFLPSVWSSHDLLDSLCSNCQITSPFPYMSFLFCSLRKVSLKGHLTEMCIHPVPAVLALSPVHKHCTFTRHAPCA